MKLRIWILRALVIAILCATYSEARKTPSRPRITHKNKANQKKNNSNTIKSKYSKNQSLADSYPKRMSNTNI